MPDGGIDNAAIAAIVGPWVAGGQLSVEDQATLKAIYDAQYGARRIEDCTPCYWNDFRVYFQLKYRQRKVIMANPKYIIKPEVGYYRPFGESEPFVTLGNEKDGLSKPLTDEVAAEMKKKLPELFGPVIIENPDYKKPSPAQERVAAVQAEAAIVEAPAVEEPAVEAPVDPKPADEPKKDGAANPNAADAK